MAGAARQRRCTNGIAAMPEDVLLEVFSRVGSIKDLFRFSLTCRWWLRRFTDPAFLRRLCPGQGEGRRRAHLLGFFFQPTRFQQHTISSVSAPSFLPAPRSPLGHVDRSLTSFVADDDGTFNYAEPLAARRGFLLMQLAPRTFDDPHLLGLCNPITGERHVLPPPLADDLGRYDSYAIVTAADSKQPSLSSSPSGRFKFSELLLITAQIKSDSMHLHSYSSDTGSWRAPTVCLESSRFSMVGERSAVIHRGAAHWLCIDHPYPTRGDCLLYKLSAEVGTATARASLAKMPVRGGGSPLLCVNGDGKLSVACVYPLHVAVWTQQQEGEGGGGGDEAAAPVAMWLLTAKMRIPIIPMEVQDPNHPQLCQPGRECAWLGFKSGSVLMLQRGGVFVFDLEKKVVEKVMDCKLPLFSDERNPYIRERNGTCVAYELNLVDFFVLQLARWSM
ncbi:unnamed protein product [Urochloa humidicola]